MMLQKSGIIISGLVFSLSLISNANAVSRKLAEAANAPGQKRLNIRGRFESDSERRRREAQSLGKQMAEQKRKAEKARKAFETRVYLEKVDLTPPSRQHLSLATD